MSGSDDSPIYLSSIPRDAVESVTAWSSRDGPIEAEYLLGDEAVGRRTFGAGGHPISETPLRAGVKHGTVYRWRPGTMALNSAGPYVEGLPHGTARQWDMEGNLVGTYRMDRGTGVDLWWQRTSSGPWGLAESHYMRDGEADGFEWWFLPGAARLLPERHWRAGSSV